jgi:DNA replication protein DnaC
MSICNDFIKLRLYYLHENYEQFLSKQIEAKAGPRMLLEQLVDLELKEKSNRSTEGRIRAAKLGKFKLMHDFDWDHPTTIDRQKIEEFLSSSFIKDHTNIIFAGPQGVGKTMLAKNIGWQAILNGFKVLFISASDLIIDLGSQESTRALQRRLRCYQSPDLLIIDEIGYLSFDLASSDLLFKVICQRYETGSIIVTTNLAFKDWGKTFPGGASSLTAMIDRLTHYSAILKIDAPSYRAKQKNMSNNIKLKDGE